MQRYVFPAVVERSGSGYGIYFPDLPGCVSAAQNLADVPAHAREALQLHLSGMREDREPAPQPSSLDAVKVEDESELVGLLLVEASDQGSSESVTVSLPRRLIDSVDRAAAARGQTREHILADSAEALLAS